MIAGWELPRSAQIGGVQYTLHADYRDILEIFTYLEDPELPEYLRWQIALALFYEEEIPAQDQQAKESCLTLPHGEFCFIQSWSHFFYLFFGYIS